MSVLINIKNTSVCYGTTEAIRDISCEIEKGDFVGLVGPNGGGKTTLVKTILGLFPTSSGRILLFGEDLKDFSSFEKIGYLPQKQNNINVLFPISVEEVVMLGFLSTKKWPKRLTKDDWLVIDATLETLGIIGLKGRLLSELSGGQQQKVLLARALVSKPEVLILDEPSTALDPNSREQFFQHLKKLNKEMETTIILITHDTGYVGRYANKLLYLDNELVFFGKVKEFCPSGEISSCFEKSDKHIIWHQHN